MTAPTFVENWFTDASCSALAGLVREVAEIPGRIVELGSWEGRSTIAIANAAPSRTIHAVDHWQGAASDTYQREQVTKRDVWEAWNANMVAATPGNVKPFRMDWRVYHQAHDGQVALVFIDADHTYEEVTAQIKAFRPLMSPGGIICGDDYPMAPVAKAVRRQLGNVHVNGRVWSYVAL